MPALWAVGTRNPDPAAWGPWDEVALVVADDPGEARMLAEVGPDWDVVQVDLTVHRLLLRDHAPDWGEDT